MMLGVEKFEWRAPAAPGVAVLAGLYGLLLATMSFRVASNRSAHGK